MLFLTGSKVAIQAKFDSDTSPGGIIIPDIAKERSDQGIVKYIGPLVKDVKVGDYVLFGGYDGTVVRLEGEGALIIMREKGIKCTLGNIFTDIDSIYFRGKINYPQYHKDILEVINDSTKLPSDKTDRIFEIIAAITTDMYFPATYESIIEVLNDQAKPIPHSNKYLNRENPIEMEMEDEDEAAVE